MKNKRLYKILAQHYLKQGFSVIPVHGKSPLIDWKEFQSRLPTFNEIENWFSKLNPTGVAIVCGKVSNIVVLDIEASQQNIESLNIPKTPTVLSGGGGRHFYFRYPKTGSVKSVNLRQKMNIDGELKSDGTYVVAPRSEHVSGRKYEWETHLDALEMADVPEWLISQQSIEKSNSISQPNDWEEIIDGVNEGSRNLSFVSIVGKYLRYIPPYNWEDLVWPTVRMINENNSPPIEEGKLRASFESIAKKELARRAEVGISPQDKEMMEAENLKLNPVRLNDLLTKDLPETQWTIYQLIPEGALAVLSAPPAHHKTWLALYFAIQVASGEKVFEKFSTTKCNVLFVEEDTNDRLIQSRVRKLSSSDNSSLFFLFRCGLKFDNPHMMSEFTDFIKEHEIKFVIFDSLIQFHGKDENVNKDMALVFSPLKKITDLGVSVLVLHHHRKESADEDNMSWKDRSQSLRGASMILSLLNSHLVVHRQSQNKSILRQTKLWEMEEMKPLEFELVDENDKVVFKCLGEREPEKDKKTLAKETILANLSEERLTRNQLVERLEDIVSASIVANLIAEMKRSGEIVVLAKIGKNHRVEQYGLSGDEFDDDEESNEDEL